MSATPFRLTPRLARAARALLGWRQQDLAEASGIPQPTIEAFEAKKDQGAKMATLNNRAAVEAMEKAGVQFIAENGGGAGVRLAKPGSAFVESPDPEAKARTAGVRIKVTEGK